MSLFFLFLRRFVMTIFIPIKAIIIFVLIAIITVVAGLASDIIKFIEKHKGEENACKKKKS